MSTKTHPIQPEELMAYLDGELTPDRAGRVVTHLERCRDCQALAADFQGVSRRLMSWQVEPSDARLSLDIFAFLESKKAAQPSERTWRTRLMRWRWAIACVPVLALALIMFMPAKKRVQRKDGRPLPAASPSAWLMAQPEPAPQAGDVQEFVRTKNPLIVHTARLALRTNDFDKARVNLDEIVKRRRGYFGQMSASTPAGASRVIEAILRVPTTQFEAIIADLKKLGRVESESRTGEEVTQQYVDLEARLLNSRNTERRLTELLERKAGKLTDVLAVEKEISRVREEIERMEAERKSLINRVDFATLTVKLVEDYKAQLQMAPDSAFTRFHNAGVEGYKSLVEGVVQVALFLLSYGPSVLFWSALLFFPARFLWKKSQRHTADFRLPPDS